MKILTGKYDNYLGINSISISGDKGRSVGFNGFTYTKLGPKLSIFKIWHDNKGKLSDEENNLYYMNSFYDLVLASLSAEDVYSELSMMGDIVILLCYEDSNLFCHRHLVAAWLEYELDIHIDEVSLEGDTVIVDSTNEELKDVFKTIICKKKNSKVKQRVL